MIDFFKKAGITAGLLFSILPFLWWILIIKEELREEKIINFNLIGSKKRYMVISPTIFFAIAFFLSYESIIKPLSLIWELSLLISGIIMCILMFLCLVIIGMELYYFVSHPLIIYCIIKKIINPILNTFSKIKKEKIHNETLYMLAYREDIYQGAKWDYCYFFFHLIVISILLPIAIFNVFPYEVSVYGLSIDIISSILFFALISISPILFSLSLNFYWKKRKINISISKGLIISTLMGIIIRLPFVIGNENFNIENNSFMGVDFYLSIIAYLFFISAFSLGFLCIREYCTERIERDPCFGKMMRYSI